MTFDEYLWFIRLRLEKAFAEDTCLPGTWNPKTPSTGHCAAVAVILYKLMGGDLVSTTVGGTSHWFNRINFQHIDLTADQFSIFKFNRFVKGPPWVIYPNAQIRYIYEVDDDTTRRAYLLAERAGIGLDYVLLSPND